MIRGAHSTIDRGPWCTKCGWFGAVTTATIDPAHPIGRCTRGDPRTEGCGRVPLTYSAVERQAIHRRLAARLATGRHHRHGPTTYTEPNCAHCQAEQVRAAGAIIGTESGEMFPPDVAPEGEST